VVDEPRKVFERIIRNVKLLYRAGLVHADLSEYNVLLLDSKPYLIDFSQSTVLAHPNAAHWLRRDIRNICRYFSKLGIRAPEQETYMKITES
jgi:RIO kinase 1